jgi:glutamate racemase
LHAGQGALFERALPGVQLVDTAEAIARQTARFADELVARGEADVDASPAPGLRAWSSGSPQVLQSFAQRWLGLQVDVQDMRC